MEEQKMTETAIISDLSLVSDCSEDELRNAFGIHLMLDCYDCAAEVLDDITACYDFLDQLVEVIGAVKQTQPYVFRTPPEFVGKQGLSGWVPIVESGISVHTLTESRFVSLDVYSCKRFDNDLIISSTADFLQPHKISANLVLRGRRSNA